jgi:hypothetical protein
VGLPLGKHEAVRLISHCEQAPFGMGERTVVDKEVRDTWEMDASKVEFLNEDWDEWIQEDVVKEVCAALGVNVEASKPRAELYKLLVYETGSQYAVLLSAERTQADETVPQLSTTRRVRCPIHIASSILTIADNRVALRRLTGCSQLSSSFYRQSSRGVTLIFHIREANLSSIRAAKV